MAGGSLRSLAALRKQGNCAEALARLRDLLRRDDLDSDELERAGRWLVHDLKDDPGAIPVRILGQCTTSWLTPMIAARAWARGHALAVRDGEYDNIMQELNTGSASGVVVFVPWTQRLLAAGVRPRGDRVEDELAFWRQAWSQAVAHGDRIVQVGFDRDGSGPLGHHLASGPGGDVALVRELNQRVRDALPRGAYFVDLEQVAGQLGRASFYDPRQYHWTKQPFSMAGAGLLAHHVAAGISAILRGPQKVLVVDLDNTLWGGVVGETGPLGITLGETADGEAHRALQLYLQGLARRGVLLAVASKNNPDDAREPFGAHPDMVLALDDFAAFEASWDPKSAALRRIAEALGLGLDSFVFLADNPAEREHVRQALPEVEVVELPDEPAGFVRALEAGLWFESVAITEEDRARNAQYAAERRRGELEKQAGTLDEYLASLEMVADVRAIDGADLPRVVQLLAKTNQFNLTTRRHGEAQVRALLDAPGSVGLSLRLRDRFGDHGLVAVLLAVPLAAVDVRALLVDTWLMSCRVIGRTVEQALAGELIRRAEDLGYRRLIGEYLPTRKNALVAGLYEALGFSRLAPDADPDVGDGAARFVLELPVAELPRTFVARDPAR